METKLCKKCNTFKSLAEMKKRSEENGVIKYCFVCKVCDNKRRANLTKTVHGLIDQLYGCNVRHSKVRGHNPPEYSKTELTEWILAQPHFKQLYDNWVNSSYETSLIPSIDRLDDYKGYSIANIRLVTLKQNKEKAFFEKKNGLGKVGKICQSVVQITLDGKFVARYASAKEAGRQTKIGDSNIWCCAMGKHGQRVASGFVWVFEKDYLIDPVKWHKQAQTRSKRVQQFDLHGNCINTFCSLRDAAEVIGVTSSAICSAVKSKTHFCRGFIWKYAD